MATIALAALFSAAFAVAVYAIVTGIGAALAHLPRVLAAYREAGNAE